MPRIPMRYQVLLEGHPLGGYVAECVEIPGALAEGATEKEVLENLGEALARILDERRSEARETAALSGADIRAVTVHG
ncbi:MAG TPA: type II toxin-antitoxin system HicB family antitoxin [Candidatus Thermoplasmatota archaeon]|nr:type II toxin-antitoxin system HicB family antitoxin [Candidatus Thermoplasmatota archaeon]